MIQNTLENRVILHLLEALAGGLVFLICIGKCSSFPPSWPTISRHCAPR